MAITIVCISEVVVEIKRALNPFKALGKMSNR